MSTLEAGKKPRDTILKPAVTEKSPTLMDEGKYTFEVDPRTNKTEIEIAVGAIFGAKAGQVAIQNRKDETYRTYTGQGKRKDVKRAIVILREEAIDTFDDRA